MTKRTVTVKPETRAALKASGFTDAMVDDVAKLNDDGLANASTRIAELDAQIAQCENDRSHWIKMRDGYQAALDQTCDIIVESEHEESVDASEAQRESDGHKT